MTETGDHPSGARVLAGVVGAGVAAPGAMIVEMALMYSPAGPSIEDVLHMAFVLLIFGIPFALAHAGLLGLPVYLVLRKMWALRWWNAAAVGFVVGMLPLALLTLDPAATSAGIGDEMTVVSGRYTAAGWRYYFQALVSAGSYGAVGGLAFWFVVARGGRFVRRART